MCTVRICEEDIACIFHRISKLPSDTRLLQYIQKRQATRHVLYLLESNSLKILQHAGETDLSPNLF